MRGLGFLWRVRQSHRKSLSREGSQQTSDLGMLSWGPPWAPSSPSLKAQLLAFIAFLLSLFLLLLGMAGPQPTPQPPRQDTSAIKPHGGSSRSGCCPARGSSDFTRCSEHSGCPGSPLSETCPHKAGKNTAVAVSGLRVLALALPLAPCVSCRTLPSCLGLGWEELGMQ